MRRFPELFSSSPFIVRVMTLAIFTAVMCAPGISCRATNPNQEAELSSLEGEKPWFDIYGEQVDCAVPAGGCKQNTYDVAYVDQCVAKGFQAKNCGCTAACSGRISTKEKVAVTAAGKDQDPNACPEAARTAINGATKVDAGQAKCIRSLVCDGDPSDCDAPARATANTLRSLMRDKCKAEVSAAICGGGAKDTLTCADHDLDTLAALYAKAFAKEAAAFRRCAREQLCNKSATGCSDADSKAILPAKAALANHGCNYWLSSICSIDGK